MAVGCGRRRQRAADKETAGLELLFNPDVDGVQHAAASPNSTKKKAIVSARFGVDATLRTQPHERCRLTTVRKALLVEDEVLVAALAVDALEELGYQIVEAATAKAALKLAHAGIDTFAVAIIDVGLPDGRGDALALELRGLRADLPIIIATGYGESALDGRLRDQQMIVLGKPYDIAQLHAAIKSTTEVKC
jgi:CheY-like chemotaxis protein